MSQTATLTFDLTDPDARAAFSRACNADNAHAALIAIAEYLREQVKYHDEKTRDDIHEMRAKFYGILGDYEVSLDA
jgi:copper(I)-binding protein